MSRHVKKLDAAAIIEHSTFELHVLGCLIHTHTHALGLAILSLTELDPT